MNDQQTAINLALKYLSPKILRELAEQKEKAQINILKEKKYCNCAECGKKLESSEVKGRIKGRPYCLNCLNVKQPQGHESPIKEDHGPWQDNAIRSLEEN